MERARLINPGASPKPVVTWTARSDQDIDDLIREIRDARNKSRTSGGAYGVYRKVGGVTVLAIQIQIPARQLKAKKREV